MTDQHYPTSRLHCRRTFTPVQNVWPVLVTLIAEGAITAAAPKSGQHLALVSTCLTRAQRRRYTWAVWTAMPYSYAYLFFDVKNMVVSLIFYVQRLFRMPADDLRLHGFPSCRIKIEAPCADYFRLLSDIGLSVTAISLVAGRFFQQSKIRIVGLQFL